LLNCNNPNDLINIIINHNNLENFEKESSSKVKQKQIQHGFTPIPFNAGNSPLQVSNRYSYRAAIYQTEEQQDAE
jgi:hypothetical protein